MDINKENLHHAYLLVGESDVLVPRVLELLDGLGVSTVSNPDFFKIETDTFKIDDARRLISLTNEKAFMVGDGVKKVFVISANQFLLEAQNTLLKVFEEPAENVHFFIISPNRQIFVPTLLSRLFVIESTDAKQELGTTGDYFLKLGLMQRIEYIKEMLAEAKEEDEDTSLESPRTVALSFLNNIEATLYKKFLNNKFSELKVFEHIFQVRHNLRQSGSAPKMLLESVALVIPEKI